MALTDVVLIFDGVHNGTHRGTSPLWT